MVKVETNRPDFDRLVNTWLPYQLYASRLFGRVGPNQRGGAIGFRDQLQDVLPLILLEPRLARAQIVLHAGQQFLEGDVLKWWHRAPGGGTGLGQRTKASDPHLWLPYVLARYVRETGDPSVLDEVDAYLGGPPVPAARGHAGRPPRPSRERATSTSTRAARSNTRSSICGENGLPLLRAGDWNDGIDGLGRKGAAPACGWASSSPTCSTASFRWRGRRATRPSSRAARPSARGRARGARKRLVGRPLRARLRRRRPRRRDRQRDDDRLGRLFRRARIPARADRASRAASARSSGRPRAARSRRRSSSTPSPIPAASPTIRPACARTAASTATARPGSSTASSSSPGRRATAATLTRRASSPRAPSRSSRRFRR